MTKIGMLQCTKIMLCAGEIVPQHCEGCATANIAPGLCPHHERHALAPRSHPMMANAGSSCRSKGKSMRKLVRNRAVMVTGRQIGVWRNDTRRIRCHCTISIVNRNRLNIGAVKIGYSIQPMDTVCAPWSPTSYGSSIYGLIEHTLITFCTNGLKFISANANFTCIFIEH